MGTGCTQITGNLEIAIQRDFDHIRGELKEYLGNVETIHGCLRIQRFVRFVHKTRHLIFFYTPGH